MEEGKKFDVEKEVLETLKKRYGKTCLEEISEGLQKISEYLYLIEMGFDPECYMKGIVEALKRLYKLYDMVDLMPDIVGVVSLRVCKLLPRNLLFEYYDTMMGMFSEVFDYHYEDNNGWVPEEVEKSLEESKKRLLRALGIDRKVEEIKSELLRDLYNRLRRGGV